MAEQEKGLTIQPTPPTLTRDQTELIKHTVAIGATDTELQLFLYQARKRGLDPLTRQIHFIKRKQYNLDTEKYDEVGTIQTGIDGFRVIADRTGKLSGIKRGVIKENGKLVGAWAEVYRSDWAQPAREEVSFDEYCQKKKDGNPMRLWASMPETMIKKVAEAAALRMAFPEDLSGIYSHEEMHQADIEITPLITNGKQPLNPQAALQSTPGVSEVKVSPVASETPEATPKIQAETILSNGINLEWLKENLAKAKWTEKTAVSWLKSKANFMNLDLTGTVAEIAARMDRTQAEFFVKALSERVELA